MWSVEGGPRGLIGSGKGSFLCTMVKLGSDLKQSGMDCGPCCHCAQGTQQLLHLRPLILSNSRGSLILLEYTQEYEFSCMLQEIGQWHTR